MNEQPEKNPKGEKQAETLELNRETPQNLEESESEQVQGGRYFAVLPPPPPCCSPGG
jgi:hypothetical protein